MARPAIATAGNGGTVAPMSLPEHEQPPPIPVAPTAEEWRAMTQAERDAFVRKANEALQHILYRMIEGGPHGSAKEDALDVLRLHFRARGRTILVAQGFTVIYPGQPMFEPDILAVRDVLSCEEVGTLSRWMLRAATARSADEVFAEG